MAYAILFIFFAFSTGAKIYYLGGAYVYLLAAGSVVVERHWDDDVRRWRRPFSWTALSTFVALPMVLPVSTVVAVAPGPIDVTNYASYLHRFFRRVRVVTTLTNTAGLHNQEWHGHIYICTGLKRSWVHTWPELRHYD
ncbi:MAG TPA: hypothetical protein VMU68_01505 [Acidimicrobiales bacterium]|nr:hypothetical protein [Acidimicrobiales bacterium]